MKPFKSFLALNLEEYIRYRKSLGYSDKNLRSQLRTFDSYIVRREACWDALQPSFFLSFKKDLKVGPRTVNGILSTARGFFDYMVRLEYIEENPLQDIPQKKENAYIPFVFSPEQIDEMLCAIQERIRKNKEHFFEDLTVYTAIMLLARCGMRISEPLRLLLNQYRSNEGTVYIEKTKFNKDRLIPIPKAAVCEINNYLSIRKSFACNYQNPYLLAGKKENGVTRGKVYPVFHQAVKDIGIEQPRRILGNTTFGSPTPHSLRHSFAVNTLKGIKERGKSAHNALPVLSAYMGHRKIRYTAVYLKVLDAQHRLGLVDFAISRQEEI